MLLKIIMSSKKTQKFMTNLTLIKILADLSVFVCLAL